MESIKVCQTCNEFTLQGKHCTKVTLSPKPPKFSVEDKYAGLKRKAKEPELKKRGLL